MAGRQQRDLRAPAASRPGPPPAVVPKHGPASSELSFFDRIGQRLEGRKTSTPSKALAQIEKLETEGVTEVGVPVYVWPSSLGRVTGHAVACEEHGQMPVLAPSKRSAILAAARHVKVEHRGAGTILLRDSAPSKARVAS